VKIFLSPSGQRFMLLMHAGYLVLCGSAVHCHATTPVPQARPPRHLSGNSSFFGENSERVAEAKGWVQVRGARDACLLVGLIIRVSSMYKSYATGNSQNTRMTLPRWHIATFPRKFSIHGHRTLKVPHPVRSAQLTRVPPS
jgi:hypothetical protein